MKRRVLIGLGLSGGIGALGYQRRALTRGGALGTLLIGSAIWSVGGLGWSLVVIFFFVSSSLLSRLSSEKKRRVAADKFSKPGARDLAQTLANGGIAALAAAAYGLHPRHPEVLRSAFIGALATANADTWATEIGTLTPARPRLITTGRRVVPGTSGGITLRGTSAAAAGALTLGAVAALPLRRWQRSRTHTDTRKPSSSRLIAVGLCAGLAGALCDSLLGATVQAVAYCPVCDSETERAVHSCGTRTSYLRGISWLGNDAVNLLSTAFGAGVAMGLGHLVKARR